MSKLDDFKVEKLEQRLEMGKWSATAGTSTDTRTGVTTVQVGGRYTF